MTTLRSVCKIEGYPAVWCPEDNMWVELWNNCLRCEWYEGITKNGKYIGCAYGMDWENVT